MKIFIKNVLSLLNKIIMLSHHRYFSIQTNVFYFFYFNSTPRNSFKFEGSEFNKSKINVNGKNNNLSITHAVVSNSSIKITGQNNSFILEDGVHLRSADIIIRGSNCSIFIGKNTSFGGVRIIHVGNDCDINIGANCLFSDNVEIWASDTHPIYNNAKEIINKESSITIGEKVWVGSQVSILKGVEIGHGSVIGMGSVVTKSTKSNCIYAGNPVKLIKHDISWAL
jgi:acetyltransferase-like isoleucine patch superfamily enzyme